MVRDATDGWGADVVFEASGAQVVYRNLFQPHCRGDVRVSGSHMGEMRADFTVDTGDRPLPTMTETFTALYDGRKAPPLGPYYDKLPVAVPLRAAIQRTATHDVVTVEADIAGRSVRLDRKMCPRGRRGPDGPRGVSTLVGNGRKAPEQRGSTGQPHQFQRPSAGHHGRVLRRGRSRMTRCG